MPSRAQAIPGVALQVAGLTAAAYYWSQIAEIGGCGTGGRTGTIRYGPPCPPGTHTALLIMVIGLCVGMAGAYLYAVGTGEQPTWRQPSRRLWLSQLRFWCAAAVVWLVAKWFDPDPVAFRPGLEVIAVAAGALVAVSLLAVALFGRDGLLRRRRATPLPSEPAGTGGPARPVLWMLGLLVGAAAGLGAYALQHAVGPAGPLDAISVRGETVPSAGNLFEGPGLRRAFDGLTRELGATGGVAFLNVLDHSASAGGVTSGGRRVLLEVDAAAVVHRSTKAPSGLAGATVRLTDLRPEAVARIAREVVRQSHKTLVGISLSAGTRNWIAVVKEPGLHPFVANLDGTGVHRLPG